MTEGAILLHFHGDEPVELLLERAGQMPLPPYIAGKRGTDEADREDYQTMFARESGAVAAPTAALHFTDRLIAALDARGVRRETLTLHVGAGTFLPVKADDTADHRMHSEWGRIDAATAERLNAARAAGGRLIAVGTTSLRLIESAADEDGRIQPFEGDTAIFITPGYRFKAVDGLMTNFHLPRSTLFMLVSALMGLDVMKTAYAHAIAAWLPLLQLWRQLAAAAGLGATPCSAPGLGLGLRNAAEPMAQIAVDDPRQQDDIVAQAGDDLLRNAGIERLRAWPGTLFHSSSRLRTLENGGERLAIG